MNLLRNNHGSSIVGVIIASGVGLIVIGALAQAFVMQTKSVVRLENRFSSLAMKNELMAIFSYRDACTNTFAGRPIADEISVNSIKNKDNSEIYNLITQNSYDRLRINKISLIRSSDARYIATAPSSTGIMQFMVQFENTSGFQTPQPVQFNVMVTSDTNALLSQCSSIGNDNLPSGGTCGERTVRCRHNNSYWTNALPLGYDNYMSGPDVWRTFPNVNCQGIQLEARCKNFGTNPHSPAYTSGINYKFAEVINCPVGYSSNFYYTYNCPDWGDRRPDGNLWTVDCYRISCIKD